MAREYYPTTACCTYSSLAGAEAPTVGCTEFEFKGRIPDLEASAWEVRGIWDGELTPDDIFERIVVYSGSQPVPSSEKVLEPSQGRMRFRLTLGSAVAVGEPLRFAFWWRSPAGKPARIANFTFRG